MIHTQKTKAVSFNKIEHRLEPAPNPYPWEVDEDNFPVDGRTSEKLRFLLNYVRLPNCDRTQYWSFTIVDDCIELCLASALPANCDRRELIISCGAALFNLRIAIRHLGYRDLVEVFPDRDNPNLLARIGLGSRRNVSLEESFLFRAISKRCPEQLYLANRHLPKSLISELKLATDAECTRWQISALVIPDACCHEIIELIDYGDYAVSRRHRLQTSDPSFYRELDLGINFSHDAIPLVSSFTTKMLIGSQDDNEYAWLATGEALAHLILRARIDDVGVFLIDRPIQIPHRRSQITAMFPENGHPQILLCLGYIDLNR